MTVNLRDMRPLFSELSRASRDLASAKEEYDEALAEYAEQDAKLRHIREDVERLEDELAYLQYFTEQEVLDAGSRVENILLKESEALALHRVREQELGKKAQAHAEASARKAQALAAVRSQV